MAKYKYKKKKPSPSRADMAMEAMEQEIMGFWSAIANNELGAYKKGWVDNFFMAENAGKYLLDGERYAYRGSANQFLVASYAQTRDPDKGPLLFTRGEMAKIFEVENFAETPIVQNRIKSMGSLYNKPVERKLGEAWHYPNGLRWKGESDPNYDEIRRFELKKKSVKRFVFTTYPVWSLADIYDYLPDDKKTDADELIKLRAGQGYSFNPKDPIEAHIEMVLNDVIDRQAIECKTGGNKAFYMACMNKDSFTVPNKTQFVNPIEYFSTCMHELAHSTQFITGRAADRDKSSKLDRAIEEVIAETTAAIMTKHLEKELREQLGERDDVAEMFKSYYESAVAYQGGWGHEFGFKELLRTVNAAKEEQPALVRSIMTKVAKAANVLHTQTLTPIMRQEALQSVSPRSPRPGNTPTMGM